MSGQSFCAKPPMFYSLAIKIRQYMDRYKIGAMPNDLILATSYHQIENPF